MPSKVPARLGRYEIEKEIGRGMMGVVYRGRDPELKRTVAIKTAQLAFPIPDDQRQSFEQRFIAEARAAASLSHPGIVVVHDVGLDPDAGTAFIAMEYLEGAPLSERLERGPLPAVEACRIAARLAEALHHAHTNGIVHRDIKPANVMLLKSGEPKVMDFGVAKVPASQLTTAGEFFGTPSYMSPEQALGQEVDGRSDVFSLGCVLYAMLTGKRAFDAPTVPAVLAMVAHRDPPPPSSIVPSLSADVDYVVARALAKDLARRYPDGQAFANDLRDLAEGVAPRSRARAGLRAEARPVSVPPRPAGSRQTVLVLAAVIVASLAGAIGLFFASRSEPPARPASASSSASAPSSREPAGQLELVLTHPLKSARVRLFVDDEQVFEERLTSRVVQKVLSVEIRKGTFRKTVDVAPGERVIRVHVLAETFTASRRITGTFASGATRELRGEVEALLTKEVNLFWAN